MADGLPTLQNASTKTGQDDNTLEEEVIGDPISKIKEEFQKIISKDEIQNLHLTASLFGKDTKEIRDAIKDSDKEK